MVELIEENVKKAEIELMSKKLQVGPRIYYIDLKENTRGRFMKFVETLSMGRANRIVIPMSIADKFIEKLKEVIEFKDQYTSSAKDVDEVEAAGNGEDQQESKYGNVVKTLIFTVLGRKFYFDVKETKQEPLILRISHVSANRRVNITIFADAVVNLLEIMEEYVKEYPYEATTVPVTGEVKKKRTRRRQPMKAGDEVKVVTKTVVAGTDAAQKERLPKTRKAPLVVAEKPEPKSYSAVGRSYTFEVVKGEDNSFLRICEQKNIRKSTLHVPIEQCREWKAALADFVKDIPEGAKAEPQESA